MFGNDQDMIFVPISISILFVSQVTWTYETICGHDRPCIAKINGKTDQVTLLIMLLSRRADLLKVCFSAIFQSLPMLACIDILTRRYIK